MSELLNKINTPTDLKAFDNSELLQLCAEIRERLISVVSATGGHLASNLGTVELTVALHKVFDCPHDSFIFDVGHQCYTHKLLTGRNAQFETLRKENGLSGFPKPDESKYDSFIEGHASTSLSQAVGLAKAKLLQGDDSCTIAVIGDGSFGGGLAYEAINNMDRSLRRLIIVLNDNSMSISKSVGAFSKYLMRLRTSGGYVRFKERVRRVLDKTPVVGHALVESLAGAKATFRRKLFGGTFFEELGFNYVGPVDGHNIEELCSIFYKLKEAKDGPVFLHVITQKGKGYALAEDNPGAYHGVGRFDVEQGNPDISLADSFSNVFGRKLEEIAQTDRRICAVTAAMKYGTGLQYFYRSHKERFFDVGIAEQHAVTMSAGLAKGGMKPVFCVYSTFLQRAYDQLIHDVSLAELDVMLGIDRAGLVGDDGETHQGIFDAAFLSTVPGFRVMAPSNYDELCGMLEQLMQQSGPRAIRYPRGSEDEALRSYKYTGQDYDLLQHNGSKLLFVTYGREFAQVLKAVQQLHEEGIACDILKLNKITPIGCEVVNLASSYSAVLFAEEGILNGGIAQQMLSHMHAAGFSGSARIHAIENGIVKQSSVSRQLELLKLDSASLYQSAKEMLV